METEAASLPTTSSAAPLEEVSVAEALAVAVPSEITTMEVVSTDPVAASRTWAPQASPPLHNHDCETTFVVLICSVSAGNPGNSSYSGYGADIPGGSGGGSGGGGSGGSFGKGGCSHFNGGRC